MSRGSAAVKRALDILAAAIGIVLLAPLLIAIAGTVKATSPGPVFFVQERVGRGGRPFRIVKFRTMRTGSHVAGPSITAAGDARITRVGGILRRYKLDELPQLFNVLGGAMSLVGPRPELAKYVRLYPPDARERVLGVRPGITDLASLEYIDESGVLARAADPEHAYVHDVMPRKLELAMRYVERCSVWLDLRIIVATLLGILGVHWRPTA